MPYLAWILAAASLVIGGWAAVRTIRNEPVIFKQLIVAAGVLALLLATMIVAGVQIFGGHAIAEPIKFWGYFIAAAFLFPLAGVWAIAERTRWSSVVLIIAAVSFAVVQLRIHILWTGA